MYILYGTLIGFLIGFFYPIIIAFISHIKHKIENPNSPDTHSGAAIFLLMVTVPTFSIVGFIVGLILFFLE